MKTIKVVTPSSVTVYPVDKINKIVSDNKELLITISTESQDFQVSFETYDGMMSIMDYITKFLVQPHAYAEFLLECPNEVPK